MFDRGGNAVDAAIAANAAIAVTAPHLCGMGGDLFALVRTPDGEVVGLNASGRAGHGRRRRGAARRGPHRDAAAPRHPHGHRARLRRRLDAAARALRPASTWRRSSPRRSAWPRPASRPARCSSARSGCSTTTARPRFAELVEQATAAGRAGAPAGRGARRCRRSSPAAATRSTAGRSARACSRSAPGTSPRPTWRRRRPTGSTPLAADGVRRRAADDRPELAGLPPARRRPAGRARRACPTTPTTPAWAHLLVEAAATAGVRPPRRAPRGADGAALLGGDRRRAPVSSTSSAPARRPVAGRAGRHDVPVHGRRRRDGRQPDPVQRRRASARGSSSRRPASTCTTAASGSACSAGHPAELRARARGRRTRCARRWRPATASWPPCSARWAATPSRRSCCRSRPACSPTAARPPTPSPRRAGRCAARRPASTRGRAAAPPTVAVEGHAPRRGATGLAARGHDVDVGAAVRLRVRPRPRHRRRADAARSPPPPTRAPASAAPPGAVADAGGSHAAPPGARPARPVRRPRRSR